MQISDLIVEVTRKCNLKCNHCLRGNTQRLNIPPAVIYHTFSKFDSIGTLTITGGEPSLAIEQINQICDTIVLLGNHPESWYMVTNGKTVRKPFLDSVARLNRLCMSNDLSALSLSNDQFHDGVANNSRYRLEDWCEYESIDFQVRDRKITNVLAEGRAKELGWGDHELPVNKVEIEEFNQEIFINGLLYVNAKGNILPMCDMSYESQDIPELILGNVMDNNLDLVTNIMQYNDWIDRNSIHTIADIEYLTGN